MTEQPPLHAVAQVDNDGRLVIGAWTSQVFTELAELADAPVGGVTERRVYRLEPCRSLASFPAGGVR